MKNLKYYLSLAVVSALFGCSSMDVDEDEAYVENLPAGFDAAVYSELHPDLRNLQIKDYIVSYNEKAKAQLGDESIKALTEAFKPYFDLDTSFLHIFATMYVDNLYSIVGDFAPNEGLGGLSWFDALGQSEKTLRAWANYKFYETVLAFNAGIRNDALYASDSLEVTIRGAQTKFSVSGIADKAYKAAIYNGDASLSDVSEATGDDGEPIDPLSYILSNGTDVIMNINADTIAVNMYNQVKASLSEAKSSSAFVEKVKNAYSSSLAAKLQSDYKSAFSYVGYRGQVEKAVTSVDSAAFASDTALLHFLYADKYIGQTMKLSDSVWNAEVAEKCETKVDSVFDVVYKKMVIEIVHSDSTVPKDVITVYPADDGVVFNVDADGKKTYVSVTGFKDSTKTEEAKYVMDDTITVAKQGMETERVFNAAASKDTSICTTGTHGAATPALLRNYNFWGTSDDLGLIAGIPFDEFAISYQFVAFGKVHGWVYRRCTEAEKANPTKCEEGETSCDVYPTDKLYCDDNGIAREIK